MNQPLGLRTLEPDFCAMNNVRLASGWRDEISVARLTKNTHYIALESMMGGIPCMAWLPLQRVIDYWMGDQAIPADQLGSTVALAFARDAFDEKSLPPVLDILEWRCPREVVNGSEDRQARYLIQGTSIELFLDLLPERPAASRFSTPDFALQVSYRFDCPVLNASEISSLEPGDVLLLKQPRGRVIANHHHLFNFHTDGVHIVIDPKDADTPTGASIEFSSPAHPPALSKLPINVSFILANTTLTLSEIGALHAGSTIPIDSARPLVQVHAGGYVIASGELVRVGGTLGVELSEVFSTRGDAIQEAEQ